MTYITNYRYCASLYHVKMGAAVVVVTLFVC